ncbi:MAG: hypothetical protein HXX09_12230 [Bacteroidetes bacterium]|nr:hypothetical protein [Bacteroidota bacterium]
MGEHKSEKTSNQKIESFSKQLTFLSIGIIALMVFGFIGRFDKMREYCVCIANKMAYGWVAYGIAIIIGMVIVVMCINSTNKTEESCEKKCCCKSKNILLILQILAFLTGVVFTVLFGAALASVI